MTLVASRRFEPSTSRASRSSSTRRNQFNLTTRRYTEAELARLVARSRESCAAVFPACAIASATTA